MNLMPSVSGPRWSPFADGQVGGPARTRFVRNEEHDQGPPLPEHEATTSPDEGVVPGRSHNGASDPTGRAGSRLDAFA